MLITILFCALVFVVCVTGGLFYFYSKRIRNRITEQIENQNRDNIDKFDTYDDIDYNGEKLYDTYDVVGGGQSEPRYADPYYSAEQDYVQMPRAGSQINNQYWRIPHQEPAYLVMTSSAKTSPVPSKQNTPKESDLYTDCMYKL